MITSDRAVFVGGHVKPAVKDALKSYSIKNNRSMSAFMAEAIEEKLRAEGVEIIDEPVYTGEPLPFKELDAAHP